MKNIKLVASDVDGTLINNNHEVTQFTKEVVSKLKRKGIEFVIATGRSHDGAVKIAQALDIDKEGYGLICLNGLRTYHLPSEDYDSLPTMTYEQCEEMEALGEKYHMGILYCYDDIIYFQMEEIAYLDYTIGMRSDRMRFFDDRSQTKEVKSLADIKERFDNNDPILKMVFVQSDDFMDLVHERVKKDLNPEFDALMVGRGWSEIMPKRVTKGEALIEYAAAMGIKPEEIMAFGDAENDISMISRVGHGVAMENAMDTLKAVAKDTAKRNDEDGVAHYILDNLF